MNDAGDSRKRIEEKTYFAPPHRARMSEIKQLMQQALSDPLVKTVLAATQGYIMVLNEHRQLLAANQELLDALQQECDTCLLGLRPGEILNCVHFSDGPSGCGTSEHCKSCGAVLTLLSSQEKNAPSQGECRLTIQNNGQYKAFDFKVRATPLHIGGHMLTALVLTDISALKQRDILERLFFHDILNVVAALSAWSETLDATTPNDAAQEIVSLSDRLKAQIQTHRLLLKAEQGDLSIHCEPTLAADVLQELEKIFAHTTEATGKTVYIEITSDSEPFKTDINLLLRVLNNMITNALEATQTGGVVDVKFKRENGAAAFTVHNAHPIPEDIQPHIFERNFSTKEKRGRGLGTYSMKLFGESYLGGNVSFTSTPQEGTTFSIVLSPKDTLEKVTAPLPEKAPKPKRYALLIEAEEALLRLEKLMLQQLGYTVLAAPEPDQALLLLQQAPTPVQLVLTDTLFVEQDYKTLCKLIPNNASTPPILLASGLDMPIQHQIATAVGVKAFILKPFNLQELNEVIQTLFPPTQN